MIRNLQRSELMDSLELSQYAFRYSLSQKKIEKRLETMDPATVYGCFDEDNQMLAKLHLLPFDIFFAGKKMKMGGLAGVATWPENRRKGLVRQLIQHALQTMNEGSCHLSMLHPFSVGFYRSFGWELTCDFKKYKIHKIKFPPFHKTRGRIQRIADNVYDTLNPVYELFSERFNGSLVRNEVWWKSNVVGTSKVALYRDGDNQAKGYIIYSIKEKVMEIDEFVSLNKESWSGLWNFIRNHDSMIEEVTIVTPPDDESGYLMADPNIGQEQHAYFMARIVNVLEVLKSFPFKDSNGQVLFLHVTDELAPWNSGSYSLVCDGKDTDVNFFPLKGDGASCQTAPQRGLSLTINELTALLFNYKRPQHLFNVEAITGKAEDVQLFEQILPAQTPFIYDFF